MKKINFSFFISFGIIIAGVFILSYSLTSLITYVYNYNHYSEVTGKIVGYTLGENDTKAMVISYVVNEKEYKIYSNFNEKDNYLVGYGIVVKYNPKKPENYILGDEELKIGNTILGAGLTIVGLCGIVGSLFGKKKKEDSNE